MTIYNRKPYNNAELIARFNPELIKRQSWWVRVAIWLGIASVEVE